MKKHRLYIKNGQLHANNCNRLSGSGITVFWQGFIYIDGFIGQNDSVGEFIRLCTHEPIEHAVAKLRGCFFCVVQDTAGDYNAFVDNSGMYTAYLSECGVSESYLDIVGWLNLTIDDLDWVSVAEFVQTANVFFNRTHFDCIQKLAFDVIAKYPSVRTADTTSLDVLKKNVPVLSDHPTDNNLRDTFNGLALALSGSRVSVDVTGGLDTRTLIAGLESAGVDFELAVSGSEDHNDVKLSHKVGDSIGRLVNVTAQDVHTFSADIESTLISLDGLKGHILTQHRINQLQIARGTRGIQLSLRGIGGELFRDFRWTHDFPNYRSRKTRFGRFNRLRVEVVRFPQSLLGSSFKEDFAAARERRLAGYKKYIKPINSQSYDMVDWYETFQNLSSRAMSVSATDSVDVFCPLAEVHRLQHGYHCPRFLRFGSLFQKRFITRCHPDLAKVKTTYGASASTAPLYLLIGSVLLTITNVKKLVRKVSQTYLGISPFMLKAPNHSSAMTLLRESEACRNAICALKRHGVLDASISADLVPERFVERLICIGWFIMRLESHDHTIDNSD